MRTEINVTTGESTEHADAPTIAPTAEQIIAGFDAALDALYDRVAQAKRYRDRYTCALRAGLVGSPYQAEGAAFGAWMDQCNALGYQLMDDVKSGRRPMPTEAEFIAELPAAPW